jgi:hypothetical protein
MIFAVTAPALSFEIAPTVVSPPMKQPAPQNRMFAFGL